MVRGCYMQSGISIWKSGGSAALTTGTMGGSSAMNAVTRSPLPDPETTQTAPLRGVSLTVMRMLVISLIAAIVVFLVGATLDYVLLHDEHDSRFVVLEVSDALGGLVAGALMFRLLQYERERRERLRHKLTVISDMNHHVRNALQVIRYAAYIPSERDQVAHVDEAIERIDWALREILPGNLAADRNDRRRAA